MATNPRIGGAVIALLLVPCLSARTRVNGNCEQGGNKVLTVGVPSTSFVQQSFPGCLVLVTVTGSLTRAAIYSDNLDTPLANPFNGVSRLSEPGSSTSMTGITT